MNADLTKSVNVLNLEFPLFEETPSATEACIQENHKQYDQL